MTTQSKRARPSFALASFLLCAGTLLQGCGRVVDLEGVYFPSWVICLLVGVSGSATALYYLQRGSLRDCLPNHGLCFVCFATILGILTWLIFFRS